MDICEVLRGTFWKIGRIHIQIYLQTLNEPKYGAFYLNNKVRVHELVLLVQLSWRIASPLELCLDLSQKLYLIFSPSPKKYGQLVASAEGFGLQPRPFLGFLWQGSKHGGPKLYLWVPCMGLHWSSGFQQISYDSIQASWKLGEINSSWKNLNNRLIEVLKMWQPLKEEKTFFGNAFFERRILGA